MASFTSGLKGHEEREERRGREEEMERGGEERERGEEREEWRGEERDRGERREREERRGQAERDDERERWMCSKEERDVEGEKERLGQSGQTCEIGRGFTHIFSRVPYHTT